MRRALPLALAALAALSCSGGDGAPAGGPAPGAAPGSRGATSAPEAPDWERPRALLALSGDDLARRLGSFEWTAAVEWTASRGGERRVRAVERHQVRQLADGAFRVLSELDPGLGEGSGTGREVVFAGGTTYARSLPAPFRARPTDRGRDARRARDETLGLAADVAALYGDALRLEPAGEVEVLGRRARRFTLALAPDAERPAPPPRPFPASGPDEDTRRRLAFLDGRLPLSVKGEVAFDAETGAPLRVRLDGALGVAGDRAARTAIQLSQQVKALGGKVAAVTAPENALPDARKPAGVADALEAAGLRKRADAEREERAAPADEAE
jgi:hypothetical protein